MKVKYIAFDNDGIPDIIVFSQFHNHNEVAHRLRLDVLGPDGILGAGFIEFSEEGPYCYGESISLNKQSREKEDTDIAWKRLCP